MSLFHEKNILDFHTHRQRHKEDSNIFEIISIHLGQEKACDYFTIGMHPWWTTSVSEDQLEALENQLKADKCLAVGEMGLDKLKGSPLETQQHILRAQLKIAALVDKPVIIHCVRAFDQLSKIKKEFPNIKKWCIHGYGRHVTLAKQLINQGFYLSIMPTVSQEKYKAFFKELPNDRLFLETDSMPNMSIGEVYQKVYDATGIKTDRLRKMMSQNATNFFSQ